MALKAAEWVHGTIAEVEFPENLATVSQDGLARKGWGTHFWGKEDSINWFHFPISTPVIIDGNRPKLSKLFVFFKTIGTAKLIHIHIYDGGKKVKSFNNLNRTGDHTLALDPSNSWIITPNKTINYGLGISVCIGFGKKTSNNYAEVVFATVGADFK